MFHTALFLLALMGVAFSSPVEVRQANNFTANTQNLQPGQCAATMVIFARGTSESGNVGTVVGPPFFQALSQQVGAGNLAVQGVQYAANVQGFVAGGDAQGSKTMAQLVQQTVSQCNTSKVIMSGYSQGGQLVHNAATMLPAEVSSKLAGAVIFGDPNNGTAVQGVPAAKTKVICHQTDNICQGGSSVSQAHLTYGQQNAGEAAQFAAAL